MVRDGPVDDLSLVEGHNQNIQRQATKEHAKKNHLHKSIMQQTMSKKALLLKVSSESSTIADDDPRQLPMPDILNVEQMLTNESQKKVKIQHSQGGANHADDDPIQQERSSDDDDMILPRVGTSVAVTAQENCIFSLHARAVDEESPSLSAGPIVEAIPISNSELPESLPLINSPLKSRKCRIISALTVALVIAALLAVVLLTNAARGNKTQAPTSGNEITTSNTFLAELKLLLSDESLIALDDPASPQSQSLGWLLERSNFRNWPFDRQVQRYAMATIYYATEGRSWSNGGGNWLSNETECQWFQGSEGDFCGENGTQLMIPKSNQ
jgi:hypothetical protein